MLLSLMRRQAEKEKGSGLSSAVTVTAEGAVNGSFVLLCVEYCNAKSSKKIIIATLCISTAVSSKHSLVLLPMV